MESGLPYAKPGFNSADPQERALQDTLSGMLMKDTFSWEDFIINHTSMQPGNNGGGNPADQHGLAERLAALNNSRNQPGASNGNSAVLTGPWDHASNPMAILGALSYCCVTLRSRFSFF